MYLRATSLLMGYPFKRGVFQGDSLSPIIFLMVFNPSIELIPTSKNDCGFNLNGEKIITLTYADDFCLITTDLSVSRPANTCA